MCMYYLGQIEDEIDITYNEMVGGKLKLIQLGRKLCSCLILLHVLSIALIKK